MVDRYAVSEAEWAAGGMEPAKLARLARSFARDGAVVLENCLPHGVLDALALRMDSDAAHQLAESKWEERGANGAGGHLQQGPPRRAPYVHREIVANMFLEQAATAALGGGDCFLSFYNGESPFPGSGFGPAPASAVVRAQATRTSPAPAPSSCTSTRATGTGRTARPPRRPARSGRTCRPTW